MYILVAALIYIVLYNYSMSHEATSSVINGPHLFNQSLSVKVGPIFLSSVVSGGSESVGW